MVPCLFFPQTIRALRDSAIDLYGRSGIRGCPGEAEADTTRSKEGAIIRQEQECDGGDIFVSGRMAVQGLIFAAKLFPLLQHERHCKLSASQPTEVIQARID